MKYCGEVNFTDIWLDKGLNPCFIDTVTSTILFVFMLVFGCLQCSMFRKYSTPIDTNSRKGTLGFTFQVWASLAMVFACFKNVLYWYFVLLFSICTCPRIFHQQNLRALEGNTNLIGIQLYHDGLCPSLTYSFQNILTQILHIGNISSGFYFWMFIYGYVKMINSYISGTNTKKICLQRDKLCIYLA